MSGLVWIEGWWYHNIPPRLQLKPVHYLPHVYKDGVASFFHHRVQSVDPVLFHLNRNLTLIVNISIWDRQGIEKLNDFLAFSLIVINLFYDFSS